VTRRDRTSVGPKAGYPLPGDPSDDHGLSSNETHDGVVLLQELTVATLVVAMAAWSDRSPQPDSVRLQLIGGRVGRRPIPEGRAAPFRRSTAGGTLLGGGGRRNPNAGRREDLGTQKVRKTSNFDRCRPTTANHEIAGQRHLPQTAIGCQTLGISTTTTADRAHEPRTVDGGTHLHDLLTLTLAALRPVPSR
jgi:hypothetical protein